MQIKDILNINEARLIQGEKSTLLNNFSIDTRTLEKDATYVGIKGESFDGNTFYEEALKKGAKTCILSNIKIDEEVLKKYPSANIIMVDDTITFLGAIARKKRESLKVKVIAVTGSVGKTSTKNVIADVLACKYKVLKTKGNLNTNIGLSLTLLSLTDEEIVVLEMGMSKFGEISELTNIAKPDLAVITNIGTAHIGNLGSRENILKAKLEIIEGLNGPLIINIDNDMLNNWYTINKEQYNLITYSIDNKSLYQASNLSYDKNGSHFKLKGEDVTLNVLGKHFIYNAVVAFLVGDLYHINHEDILKALKNITKEKGRMELIKKDDYIVINDTYNASYDSVYYALEVLGKYPNRKIAVLGDILELGEFGNEIHEKIGKLIIPNKIDILVTVGNLAQNINITAQNEGFNQENSKHFNNNKDAIDYLNKIKQKDDIILVKASHGMNFQEIVDSI